MQILTLYPTTIPCHAQVKAALKAAGFVIEEAADLALDADIPW